MRRKKEYFNPYFSFLCSTTQFLSDTISFIIFYVYCTSSGYFPAHLLGVLPAVTICWIFNRHSKRFRISRLISTREGESQVNFLSTPSKLTTHCKLSTSTPEKEIFFELEVKFFL